MKNVVLIPAYQPEDVLIDLTRELHDAGLGILVVNDGSSSAYEPIFTEVAKYATVVSHKNNSGKGAALKTGMRAIQTLFPECLHFITADADGQHTVSDILRVRDELENGADFILTVRDFKGDMPARSKFGNNLSRFIYCFLTGHYFADNQSGLRGFSVAQIEWLTKVGGEKYDYEMNMLYYADKQAIPITTITIEALYIDGNKSSHFDPVLDTLRIYRRLFASAWATFASWYIAEIILLWYSITVHFVPLAAMQAGFALPMFAVSNLTSGLTDMLIILPMTCCISLAVNIVFNRFIIFRKVHYHDALRVCTYSAIRYLIYTVFCILLGYVNVPLFLAYNVIALLGVPAEFFIRKLLHLARYRDINKENR